MEVPRRLRYGNQTPVSIQIRDGGVAQFENVAQVRRRRDRELFHDTADPHRYIEYFVDESWVEYLRRNDRITATHVALREKKFALHTGDGPPVVSRYIAVPVPGR